MTRCLDSFRRPLVHEVYFEQACAHKMDDYTALPLSGLSAVDFWKIAMKLIQRPYNMKCGFRHACSKLYDRQHYQLAFTGTFRQVVSHLGPNGFSVPEHITVEKASKNFDLFMVSLSRKVLGPSRVKLGFQLCCSGAIEGYPRPSVTGRKRMHIHASIGGIPPSKFDLAVPDDFVALDQLMRRTWQQSLWGYDESRSFLLANGEDYAKWRQYVQKDLSLLEPERLIHRVAFLRN